MMCADALYRGINASKNTVAGMFDPHSSVTTCPIVL
jgi:hypothetical protein